MLLYRRKPPKRACWLQALAKWKLVFLLSVEVDFGGGDLKSFLVGGPHQDLCSKLHCFISLNTYFQLEQAEEVTVHRRKMEVEKEDTEELRQKYKVCFSTCTFSLQILLTPPSNSSVSLQTFLLRWHFSLLPFLLPFSKACFILPANALCEVNINASHSE